jgi:cytochrome c-type biogenesis protein CcmH/NrfG
MAKRTQSTSQNFGDKLQQFDKAVLALKQALIINPKHPDAYANLGIAYQGLQQFEASTQALQRAFELEPGNANIRSYLAKAHYSLGESA